MRTNGRGGEKGLHKQRIISAIIQIRTTDATTRLLPAATITALRITEFSLIQFLFINV
jgi:hypothetical protein